MSIAQEVDKQCGNCKYDNETGVYCRDLGCMPDNKINHSKWEPIMIPSLTPPTNEEFKSMPTWTETNETKLDLRVGDKVTSKYFGNGVVTGVLTFENSYPCSVVFSNDKTIRLYTLCGRYLTNSPENSEYNIVPVYAEAAPAKPTAAPDYSFNQSIVDALKAGKSVWHKCDCGDGDCDRWLETDTEEVRLCDVFEYSWSTVKPTTTVKKKCTYFINIYENGAGSTHATKDKALASIIELTSSGKYLATAEVSGEYDVEV